jgi:electron transfer flavoprotein alpha subunit
MKSFVYIEPSVNGIDSMATQIASRVRKVSGEVRGSLVGVIVGHHLEGKEAQLSGLFDELILTEVPTASESNTEVISKVLTDVIREGGPGVLFLGFTHQGMELGPSVGWRLGIPVITGCTDLNWGQGQCSVKRPILGGKLFVSLSLNIERGAVISVQKGIWKEDAIPSETNHPVVIRHVSWRDSWAAEKTEMLGISEESLEGEEDITKAEILVSVGLGWLPASRQVGISGKTVSPVIYLALGISGQSNHYAGMNASSMIIAVNKDPQAPIFNIAHYGVVDDILEFVPAILDQTKGRQS